MVDAENCAALYTSVSSTQ